MPPTSAKNLFGRVLDVVFGKKLEGEDDVRARAAAWAPQWARTAFLGLQTGSILVAFALLFWSWGWMPFTDSRIDSLWALAALGLNAASGTAWEWMTRRQERRAKAGRAAKATFPE
jgi:hypothetical protein